MTLMIPADQILSGAVGFFSVAGAVVYGLKKNGVIAFRGDKERRKCAETCIEHGVFEQGAKRLDESVSDLFVAIKNLNEKVDRVAENLQRIAGWVERDGLARFGR